MSENMSKKKGIRLSLPFGSYQKTYEYSLIFSLRKRKWLGIPHKGIEWAVEYKLLPGTYLLFEAKGFKDSRGADLKIWLVKIEDEKLLRIKLLFSDHYLGHPSHHNKIVKDFIMAEPEYHGLLCIPPSIYDQKEVDEILRGELEPLTPPEE